MLEQRKKQPERSVRKRSYETVVRTNITLPPVLFEASQRLVQDGGYTSLSGYIQARIRLDAGLDKLKEVA